MKIARTNTKKKRKRHSENYQNTDSVLTRNGPSRTKKRPKTIIFATDCWRIPSKSLSQTSKKDTFLPEELFLILRCVSFWFELIGSKSISSIIPSDYGYADCGRADRWRSKKGKTTKTRQDGTNRNDDNVSRQDYSLRHTLTQQSKEKTWTDT